MKKEMLRVEVNGRSIIFEYDRLDDTVCVIDDLLFELKMEGLVNWYEVEEVRA